MIKPRKKFDKEFKRSKAIGSKFFAVYDLFLIEKINDRTDAANSKSTISRYTYNKTILKNFEAFTKTKLHFSKINKNFYNAFISYCVSEKKHSI